MTDLENQKDFIRSLADLICDSDLSEIEVESGDVRIRLTRGTSAVAAPVAMPMTGIAAPPQAPVAASDDTKAPAKETGEEVVAPMVGTAYAAPEPGAKPFIMEGDRVKEGQTLLIIEAMKVMNNLPSPRSGKVTAILSTTARRSSSASR